MEPGSKVLYLGAASGTTVSHVSDLVGPVILFEFEFVCVIDRMVWCTLSSSLIVLVVT